MKKAKKGDYRTRGFESTEKARERCAFGPKQKPTASSVIIGDDLRVTSGGKGRG